jgi:hypothetical protein
VRDDGIRAGIAARITSLAPGVDIRATGIGASRVNVECGDHVSVGS